LGDIHKVQQNNKISDILNKIHSAKQQIDTSLEQLPQESPQEYSRPNLHQNNTNDRLNKHDRLERQEADPPEKPEQPKKEDKINIEFDGNKLRAQQE